MYRLAYSGIIRGILAHGRREVQGRKVTLQRACRRKEKLQLPTHERQLNSLLVHLNCNRLFIQPNKQESNREYGRGNRVRKQINYSDETNNDDGLFNIAELDDFDNNAD
jgi:hypothetical protein